MLRVAGNLYDFRELMMTLAWKNISVRYKQANLQTAFIATLLKEDLPAHAGCSARW